MTATSNIVCADCGEPMPQSAVDRQPCARCGSTKLRADTPAAGPFGMRSGVTVSVKNPDLKGVAVKVIAVPSPSFDLGGLPAHREQVIDRDNDKYFERVTDYATGEVLHECEEPLSKHVGHGSAKKKL